MQHQKIIRRVIFSIFLSLIFNIGSFAQTIHVKGNIESDTIWSQDAIKVDSTVTVRAGARLTIFPGTYIEFQGHYPLNLFGELWTVGTESDFIVFTVHDTTGFSNTETSEGAWHGIRFDADGDPYVSKLQHCIIEYGKAIPPGWTNDYGGGIYARQYNSLEISNCIIRNNYEENYGAGVYFYACSAHLIQNKIYNYRAGRSGGGLAAFFGKPVVMSNIICNNLALSGGGLFHMRN